MNAPRINDKDVKEYAQFPYVVGQMARDLEEARDELQVFCLLAKGEDDTEHGVRAYGKEIAEKYGY